MQSTDNRRTPEAKRTSARHRRRSLLKFGLGIVTVVGITAVGFPFVASGQSSGPSSGQTVAAFAAAPATSTTVKATSEVRKPSYGDVDTTRSTAALSVVFAAPSGALRSTSSASEIRWIFDRPVTQLGSIDKQLDPKKFVSITPNLDGRFRWVSTRALVFEPTSVPGSSTYTVTLAAGFPAIDGTSLAEPKVTRFSTPTISCSMVDAKLPRVRVHCDQPSTIKSVGAHTVIEYLRLESDSGDSFATQYRPSATDLVTMKKIDPAGTAALEKVIARLDSAKEVVATHGVRIVREELCDEKKDPSVDNTCFVFEGIRPVVLDTVSRLKFSAGTVTSEGPLLGKASVDGRIPTERSPLVVMNACSKNCNPESYFGLEMAGDGFSPLGLDGAITVNDVAAKKSVTYRIPADLTIKSEGDVDSLPGDLRYPLSLSWAGIKPLRTYEVRVSPKARNISGRDLGYTAVRTFSIGNYPAFAFIAGGEQVIESEVNGLRLRSRNTTEVDEIISRVDKGDLVAQIRAYAGTSKDPLDLNKVDSSKITLTPKTNNSASSVVPFPDKKPGVFLVAVRARKYVGKSRYNDQGYPWNESDQNAADEAAKSAKGTGAYGDGWSSALVQRTDLAVTLKRSESNVVVVVTSLAGATPVKSAEVSLYDSDDHPYWTGKTNEEGIVEGRVSKNKACASGCDVVAVVQHDGDTAYALSYWRDWGDDVRYSDVSGSSAPDSSGGTEADLVDTQAPTTVAEDAAPKLEPGVHRIGAVFADRGVYKAGEVVNIKGYLRNETLRELTFPDGVKKATLTVTDPRNTVIASNKVDVSSSGAFDTTVTVPTAAVQGDYSIAVDNTFTSFLVTSFRKPDFVVDVKATPGSVVRGKSISFDVTGRYLYGSPMTGDSLNASYSANYLTINPLADVRGPQYQGFTWTFTCEYAQTSDTPDPDATSGDECYDSAGGDLSGQNSATLDTAGHYVETIQTPVRSKRHYPVGLGYEANVSDVSRQSFAGRTSAIVHPGEYYVGVRQKEYFTTAKKPMVIDLIAGSPDGKVVTGANVTVDLFRWDYVTTKRKNDDDTVTTVGTWKSTQAGTAKAKTAGQPVSVSFTPDKAGTYEVRAHAKDASGNYLESGFSTYVLGPDFVPWYTDDSQPQLTMIADKASYKPGDKARILIQSPFSKATGLLTVERNGVMEHRRFDVTSSATSVEIPITDEYTPNVYASVTLFKGRTGAPSKTDPSDPNRPQVQTGTLNISVPPKTKELSVSVETDKREYLPAADASAKVKVVDAKGQPAKGEVTLWAVDEGVLRLTNYTAPDLLTMMYPGRSLNVDTADSRMRLVARNRDDEKGGVDGAAPAPGGGGGDEEATVAEGIRTDFRTLAAWSATVKVGENGIAVVPMKLPESLTEYRVIAVAISGADRFGTGKSSLTIRKPFLALAALPRSVNIGDTFEAGATLRNQTGTAAPATLTIDLPANSPLVIEGPKTLTASALGDVPTELRFKFRALKTGTATFNLKAKLADGIGVERNDALRASIPVTVTRRLETVATSGTVSAGGKPDLEPITVPAGVYGDLGSLEITASSSALAGLQNGITQLAEYPYGCVEQRSSRIRVLLDLAALAAKYPLPGIKTGNIKTVVQEQINLLRTYQTDTGGLAYWPGDPYADQFISPRVFLLLLDAKDAGYKIPGGMMEQLQSYLIEMARGERSDSFVDSSLPNQAQVAWALARAGHPESGLVDFLYEKRFELSFLERVHLLHAMLEAGEKGKRPNSLFGDLTSSVRIDGGRATVDEDFDWANWSSLSYLDGGRTHDTAAFLSLLVRIDASHPLVSQLAAGLLSQRRNGTWDNTLESGYALKALLDVSRYAEKTTPDFTAKIAIGTSKLMDQKFAGSDLSIIGSSTPMATLSTLSKPGTANQLSVSADGKGTLHWAASLRYAPNLASLKPLDQGLTVERRYFPFTKTAYDKSGNLILPPASTSFKAGDLVRVVIKVSTPLDRTNLAVDDPLPAGLEALNASLASTSQADVGEGDTAGGDGNGASAYDRVEIGNGRVLFFANQFSAGEHVTSYIARATAPGTFVVAPTQAEDMYRPDVFGRNGTATIVIAPPVAKAAAVASPTVSSVSTVSTTKVAATPAPAGVTTTKKK